MAMVADAQQAASAWTPLELLLIYREEVKPGHAAAHAANETAWAAALYEGECARALARHDHDGRARAKRGSSSVIRRATRRSRRSRTGWMRAPPLRAADDRFSAAGGRPPARTPPSWPAYRPALSYQPGVNLPTMRYMQVDVVRREAGARSRVPRAVALRWSRPTRRRRWTSTGRCTRSEAGAAGPDVLLLLPEGVAGRHRCRRADARRRCVPRRRR